MASGPLSMPAPARPARRPTLPGVRVLEYRLLSYRRTWRGTLFTTFLSPVLFLSAMGLGLGGYVDRGTPLALEGIPYLAFLAPGLLAAQAMQTGTIESTWPVMAALKWTRTYDGIVATPQTPRDLMLGHVYFVTIRLAVVAAVFVAVMFAFGAVTSPLALLAVPCAVLTGLAFSAPMAAFVATRQTEQSFNAIFRFGIAPLFLFSGTFFPISQLPDVLEPIAYLTPLYHGVALSRGLAVGGLDPAWALLHLAVLIGFIVVGTLVGFVTFRRRLVK